MNPSVVLIPTSFPQEFEKLVYDKDDATEYEVKLRPSQEFSKQNAISKMENALASNPKIFQPSYEQTVALSKSWLRQNDPTSRIDLSPFYSSFFIDGNDLGVWCCFSILISFLTCFKAECIGSLVSLFEAEEGSSFDSSISAFEIVSLWVSVPPFQSMSNKYQVTILCLSVMTACTLSKYLKLMSIPIFTLLRKVKKLRLFVYLVRVFLLF